MDDRKKVVWVDLCATNREASLPTDEAHSDLNPKLGSGKQSGSSEVKSKSLGAPSWADAVGSTGSSGGWDSVPLIGTASPKPVLANSDKDDQAVALGR